MKSSKLTKKNIKHLSKLAGLKLTETELKKFPKQLSAILAYVESLNKLDTKKIEPTAQITGLENITREDKPGESLTTNEVLSNTKKKSRNFFVTKAILEK